MSEKELKSKLDEIEKLNALAVVMAKSINADRMDALIYALNRQNDLLADILFPEVQP